MGRKQSKPRAQKVREMRSLLVRLPDELIEFIEDTAREMGYSRDRLIREVLIGFRDGARVQRIDPSGSLFAQVRDRMADAMADAVRQSVDEILAKGQRQG